MCSFKTRQVQVSKKKKQNHVVTESGCKYEEIAKWLLSGAGVEVGRKWRYWSEDTNFQLYGE